MATMVYRFGLRRVPQPGGYRANGGTPKTRCGRCEKKYQAKLGACPRCGTLPPEEILPDLTACVCGHCGDGTPRCLGADRARYELPPEVTAQLETAWRFRQDLVDIEHAHEDAMKALWSSVPEIAAVEKHLATAEDQTRGLLETARKEHSAGRTAATGSELAARIRAARAREKELRARRRSLIGAHAPGKAAGVAALKQRRQEAVTACRKQHAAAGLYWASYNAALADHRVAVQLVASRRARNLRARLRHSRPDGTGTIAVQLQRATGGVSSQERERIADLAASGLKPGKIAAQLAEEGFPSRTARTVSLVLKAIASGRPAPAPKPADPPRSPALLASGEGRWRNVLQIRPWLPPEQFGAMPRAERLHIARTGEAVIAVGGGKTVTIPVAVHRMLPPDGEVAEASLTVTRTAGQWDAALNVTVRIPDPEPSHGGPPVALHCGWRRRGDGSVRVAAWSSPVPLTVPDHLRHVTLTADASRRGEIIVPARWMDRAGYPAGVRGIRDTHLDRVRDKLAAWLDAHPQHDGPAAADVRKWRSAGRFAALARQWRHEPPAGDDGGAIASMLEEWRARDRHLWEIEAHDRDQLARTRDNAWREVGAWLAGHAGTLVIDDSDLAVLRRRQDDADDDPVIPGVVQEKARARAALSAPGRLRQFAVTAARRRGVPVREVTAELLTRTCPHCGHAGDADRRYAASARVRCPHCGQFYDQDFSAATLMLARSSGNADG